MGLCTDLFDDGARLHAADFFSVWRVGDVVAVRIVGALTDARNPIWRAYLDDLFVRTSVPRFVSLDVRSAVPEATLPLRIQTALWGRKLLGRIDHGVIGIGKDARVGITVRAILRIAGMTNVTICSDDASFATATDALASR